MGLTFFFMTFFSFFRRYIQVVSLIALVMASMGLVIITVIGDGIYAHLYHSGIMLEPGGALRVPAPEVCSCDNRGDVRDCGYAWTALFAVRTDPAILAHNASNMVGIVLIGIFISYFHEYYIRQGYIQALQLEASGRKLACRNKIIERDLEQARSIQQRYMPVSRPTSSMGPL